MTDERLREIFESRLKALVFPPSEAAKDAAFVRLREKAQAAAVFGQNLQMDIVEAGCRTVRDAFDLERLKQLESVVKAVITQTGDNHCWRDVYTEMAHLVGLEWKPEVLDEATFVDTNCRHFYRCLAAGEHYVTPSVVVRDPKMLRDAITAIIDTFVCTERLTPDEDRMYEDAVATLKAFRDSLPKPEPAR